MIIVIWANLLCYPVTPLRLHSERQPSSLSDPHFYLSTRHDSQGEEGRRVAVSLTKFPQRGKVINLYRLHNLLC